MYKIAVVEEHSHEFPIEWADVVLEERSGHFLVTYSNRAPFFPGDSIVVKVET